MNAAEPPPSDWAGLAVRSIEQNPFFAPFLTRAALAHLAKGHVHLAAVRNACGRLIALAPVGGMRLGRLLPARAVWTHLYGPLGTPLIDAEQQDEAVSGLIAAMDGKRRHGALLVFPDLPIDGPVSQTLQAQARAAGRPVAIIAPYRRAALFHADEPPVAVRDGLPPKRRKELSRQLRRLSEEGVLTIEVSPAATAIDDFLALEAGGWKGARGTALARRPEAEAFMRAAIEGAEEGAAAIIAMRLDGRPVAMLLVFRSGDMAVTWKIAHDEALARFSPGVQLMLEASDRLMSDPALRRIDSLASADHPMIDRLWPDRIGIATLVIGPRNGRLGFVLGVALARAEAKARAMLRNVIRRRAARSGREVSS
ncbi:GNAT family N-acetyltransferase [Kaistia dalseonensis]|uniref:CelD/BcsL family acetyltransferase involved in cellulose biosynthesis n=1 Tax=Kaistia dalseonensis TaxID=410840 RepID=A0ABU0H4D7_9HYPH|nr:GNAT family N-acetyltransferase [Kaistia dalseonensis]MCX5494565.1 GNAT family N-acetyltransferase [Kaistia dalseonensis]MDQ0437145.1 CelD/BcsL family acetyltransferase involved in cellulose biosynthesis [Kaistia dalseonensis]